MKPFGRSYNTPLLSRKIARITFDILQLALFLEPTIRLSDRLTADVISQRFARGL